MNTSTPFDMVEIQRAIESRFDPIPHLTPEGLTSQIDQFRRGTLRPLAITMDAIEERDDLLATVAPKAKVAPTIHGWEINTVETISEGEKEKAKKQAAILERFYNNLRVTSAIDQDTLGDTNMLLEQMMDAKGKKYSVHNIVWKPDGEGGYTAKLWHTPLWFFEARTGKLRFLSRPDSMYDGEEMKEGAWLVSVGRGLMIACAVCWMYKRLPLRDWLIYCRRHGMPGFEGVTDEPEDSPGFRKLVKAVEAAASGLFAWVRSSSQQINKMDFGAEGEIPFPPLVELMNKAMSAIWRGADLSTISSGKDAEGSGASLQGEESDIIEAYDARWLSGQLNMRLDRLVLDYTVGPDEPALAYFKVKTAQKQDITTDLSVDKFAREIGHPMSHEQFAERYDRPLPGAGETLIAPPEPKEAEAINEAMDDELRNYAIRVRAGLSPAARRVAALAAASPEKFRAQAEILRKRLPGLLAAVNAQGGAENILEDILTQHFLRGLEAANPENK